MARYAWITGWGKHVPEKVLTNHDLAGMMETSDEWITARTGIKQRYIAGEDETTATMAIEAARTALRVANFHPAKLDLIIVATATPEYCFPATACLVQDALGAYGAGAFDLSAGCSGFVYAVGVASQMMASGTYDNVLVIGSETLSRITDWHDRNTAVLFGDGAGAFLLQACEEPGGVLSFALGADGSGGDLLIVPGGGSRHPACHQTVAEGLHYIKMNGREVFRFATRVMGKAAKEVIEAAHLDIDDVDVFIPHQANLRIINAAARFLNLPMERVFINVDRYGNTSAASVPIAFCEAIEEGRMKPSDHIVLVAFGAGLTWAAALVQWMVPLPARHWSWWRRALQWLRYRWARVKSVWHRTTRKADTLWVSILRRNGFGPTPQTEPEEEKAAKDE